MTPQGKLKLLLVRQFVVVVVILLAFALVIGLKDYGTLIAIALLIALRRLSKPFDKMLRETDVRLALSHKHVYFGAGLVYFLAIVSVILWYAVRHSSPPVWSLAGLVLVVLLVLLYAGADLVYGSKSRV